MMFVLDQLERLNARDSPFVGQLDLARVGAFGHSRGGQAAGRTGLLDRRFKARMNIDGNIRGRPFPPDDQGKGGDPPFLWLEKLLPRPTDEELQKGNLTRPQFDAMWANGDQLLRTIRSGSQRITMARVGIDHLDFSDGPLLSSDQSADRLAGRWRTMDIARAYTRAFFNRHLKGKKEKLLKGPSYDYPEVRVQRFGPI